MQKHLKRTAYQCLISLSTLLIFLLSTPLAQGVVPHASQMPTDEGQTGWPTGSGAAQDALIQNGLTTTQDLALEPLAAVIIVTPTVLSATLYPDQVHGDTLTIANEGDESLGFTLLETPLVDWLAEDPPIGIVLPSESMIISVTFDSAGLAPGPYSSTLQVLSNDPDNMVVPVTVTLTVLPPCVPVTATAFSWTPITPAVGESVTFSGTAEGDEPIIYTWAFGDGITATGNPTAHAYTATGTYLVVLTATNCETATDTTMHTITVLPCDPLTATAFSWTPVTPTVGEAVTFSGVYTPPGASLPIAFSWAFGDGITATGNPTAYAYTAAGTYLVALTATNCETATATAVHTITVLPCVPVTATAFTWTPITPTIGESVTFSGTAEGDEPIIYTWAFGDGITTTGNPTAHAYTAAGTYLVVLTATNCGTAMATAVHTITLPPCDPVEIDAVTTAISGCRVDFAAQLAGDPPFTYAWDFGPFGSSDEPTPTVSYGTGTWPYTLTVHNCEGADSDTYTGEVTVDCQFGTFLPLVQKNDRFWVPIDLPAPAQAVRSLLSSSEMLYIGSDAGVLRRDTCDGLVVQAGLDDWLILDLATDDNSIYAGTYGGGVWRGDCAALPCTWSQLEGLENPYAWDVEIGPTSSPYAGTLFAGTDAGVYTWTGTTWEPMNDGLPDPAFIDVLTFNSAGALYAGTWGNGVYWWNSNTWESLGEAGLSTEGKKIWAIAFFTPTLTPTPHIYLGTEDGMYAREAQPSGTWSPVGLQGFKIYSLLVEPVAEVMYVATWEDGVYFSPDGASLHRLGYLEEYAPQVYALSFSQCDKLYVGTSNGLWETRYYPR